MIRPFVFLERLTDMAVVEKFTAICTVRKTAGINFSSRNRRVDCSKQRLNVLYSCTLVFKIAYVFSLSSLEYAAFLRQQNSVYLFFNCSLVFKTAVPSGTIGKSEVKTSVFSLKCVEMSSSDDKETCRFYCEQQNCLVDKFLIWGVPGEAGSLNSFMYL